MVVEIVWNWSFPQVSTGPLLLTSGLLAGDSLVRVLTWIARGDVLAMVLAAAFLANSAGLRRGMWKGIESVFSAGWGRVLRLSLVASATAALGIPAVRFGAGGESGRLAVKLMAALWTSTAATLLLCWLILSFETASRGPVKTAKTRPAELTGQYTARLWLPVLAGTVAFPLLDYASADASMVLRFYVWPLAALLAWFPLTALRSAEAGEIHTVVSVAVRRWGTGVLCFAGWVVVAGMHFFAFHLGSGWLLSLCVDGSWWQAAVALLSAGAWAWLAAWMLGAWIAIQVDRLPSGAKDARSSRLHASA